MKVTFWGVRGSIPSPRMNVLRYGGNTTCVQVVASGQTFVIDAGTGIIPLGREMLLNGPSDFTLLLTHLHHDHTQGFPFFQPASSCKFCFTVYAANFFSKSAREVFADSMADPFFPVPLSSLKSKMSFCDLDFGHSHEIKGLCNGVVDAMRLFHPREGVVIYKFHEDGKTLVFATDCEHYAGRDELMLPFIKDTDCFVHDTMYTEGEYNHPEFPKLGWGHSTIEHAVALSKKAGAKKLVCTHHEPTHTDDFLDEMFGKARQTFPNLIGAYEGLTVEV